MRLANPGKLFPTPRGCGESLRVQQQDPALAALPLL